MEDKKNVFLLSSLLSTRQEKIPWFIWKISSHPCFVSVHWLAQTLHIAIPFHFHMYYHFNLLFFFLICIYLQYTHLLLRHLFSYMYYVSIKFLDIYYNSCIIITQDYILDVFLFIYGNCNCDCLIHQSIILWTRKTREYCSIVCTTYTIRAHWYLWLCMSVICIICILFHHVIIFFYGKVYSLKSDVWL